MTINSTNTLPYTYQYGEPFTHTGVWPRGKRTKSFDRQRFHPRWDNWDGSGQGSPTWLHRHGDLCVRELDVGRGVPLEPGAEQRFDAGGEREFSGRYLHTLVWTRPFCEKYTYVLQSDFGSQGRTSDFAEPAKLGRPAGTGSTST